MNGAESSVSAAAAPDAFTSPLSFVHCELCLKETFTPEGELAGEFWITSCGCVVCHGCRKSQRDPTVCPACTTAGAQLVPLTHELPPDIAVYFRPLSSLLSDLGQALKFQSSQMTHLNIYLRRKVVHQRDVLQRASQELGALKNVKRDNAELRRENEALRAQLGQRSGQPPPDPLRHSYAPTDPPQRPPTQNLSGGSHDAKRLTGQALSRSSLPSSPTPSIHKRPPTHLAHHPNAVMPSRLTLPADARGPTPAPAKRPRLTADSRAGAQASELTQFACQPPGQLSRTPTALGTHVSPQRSASVVHQNHQASSSRDGFHRPAAPQRFQPAAQPTPRSNPHHHQGPHPQSHHHHQRTQQQQHAQPSQSHHHRPQQQQQQQPPPRPESRILMPPPPTPGPAPNNHQPFGTPSASSLRRFTPVPGSSTSSHIQAMPTTFDRRAPTPSVPRRTPALAPLPPGTPVNAVGMLVPSFGRKSKQFRPAGASAGGGAGAGSGFTNASGL